MSLGAHDDKFDSINGVIINPRKTIDFSELRRFRLNDAADEDERAEEGRNKRRTSKKANRAKPKVMMTKNMKALLTYPPAFPRSPDCPSNVTCEKYFGPISKSSGKETRKEEREQKHQQQQQRSKPIPILTKPGKETLKEGTDSPNRRSPIVPPKQRQLNVTYDFSDELSSSPTCKRVNFNSFVTVEDGEMSTLEMLKSSNNSAQLIKQRYLGKSHEESVPVWLIS